MTASPGIRRRRILQNGLGLALGALSLAASPPGPLTAGVAAWPEGTGPLPEPTGRVVLTLRGDLARQNGPSEARLDIAMLEALPRTGFSTSTVWTEGVARYEGVLLTDLLAALGAGGRELSATAIDGYVVVIPVDELGPDGPILAFLRDGAPMPVRDRGPLWLIYPYDDNPAYRNDTTYARSIWQLTLIELGG
jgi:hypothetical protein